MTDAPSYDVQFWFWSIPDGTIYSSHADGVVPVTDPDYVSFLADGGIVTVGDSLTVDALRSARIKQERGKLLTKSDWTQMPDSPLTASQKSAWVVYRQELRDITKQPGYPASVTWPVAP